MRQIEIFKTNVRRKTDAIRIVRKLSSIEPSYISNFDIEDCDCILRIESIEKKVNIHSVIKLLKGNNFNCEVHN